MRRLTIKLRISAYALVVAVAFAAFMILFFPWQAARLGDRVMQDTAVTIASVFAASIEPAYGSLGAGGEQVIETALRNLSSETPARAPARRRADAADTWARIAVQRATVYGDSGARLAGIQRRRPARSARRRSAELSIEPIADGDGLRVTAPVFATASTRASSGSTSRTQTFAELARSNSVDLHRASRCSPAR